MACSDTPFPCQAPVKLGAEQAFAIKKLATELTSAYVYIITVI